MQKSVILRIALFLLLVFLCDRGIGYLISKGAERRGADPRIAKLLAGKIDADLVIVGSSRAARNLSPQVFEEELGQPAYSIALPGSNIEFHRVLIDLLIERNNPPRRLLLTLEDISFKDYTQGDLGGINFRQDALRPFLRDPLVGDLLAKRADKARWATKVSHAYRENMNLSDALQGWALGPKKASKIRTFGERGDMLLSHKSVKYDAMEYGTETPAYDPAIEKKSLVEEFHLLAMRCEKAGIELTVVLPPVFSAPAPGFAERIGELASSNPRIEVLDLRNFIRDKHRFYDPTHLNADGAELLSSEVAQRLRSRRTE